MTPPAPSTVLDTAALRKARGAFFTPMSLAQYVTDWAIRSSADSVLEPSCGEAAFLLAAVDRLSVLSGQEETVAAPVLHGVELHEASAQAARDLVRAAGVSPVITTADFFTLTPSPDFDAVVGNPPYIRYQEFAGQSRARAKAAALAAGVSMSGLASSWAAFTVHSALFLKPGGRLGLVIPAELLTVNYAASVREFLMQRFSSVRLVTFTERVFGPDVLEEVVLLLADGYDPTGQHGTDHCELFEVRNARALSGEAEARRWKPARPSDKWTPSLLSTSGLIAYTDATSGEGFAHLEEWGDTTLGAVTGNNRYFALSPERVRELELQPTDLVRLSPPGSAHLRALTFSDSAWAEMGTGGSATWLFRPAGDPSEAAWAYIRAGETAGVHQAYKCRVRRPWWRVPLPTTPDLFLTYMNADTPRLSANRARVAYLNSVHGIALKDGLLRAGKDLLPVAALNSVTLVGAETVGRAYGGGMLKIEPREADRLPVPAAAVVTAARADLAAIRPQVGALLKGGRLLDAVGLVDDVLLVGTMGMSRASVKALREAHRDLAARRTARGTRVTDR